MPVAVPGMAPLPADLLAPLPQTADEILLDLLHGKNKVEFLPLALSNDQVKADPVLVASVVQDTWIAAKIATRYGNGERGYSYSHGKCSGEICTMY